MKTSTTLTSASDDEIRAEYIRRELVGRPRIGRTCKRCREAFPTVRAFLAHRRACWIRALGLEERTK